MAGINVHDDRNRCSPSVGIAVHVRPECPFTMGRNTHTDAGRTLSGLEKYTRDALRVGWTGTGDNTRRDKTWYQQQRTLQSSHGRRQSILSVERHVAHPRRPHPIPSGCAPTAVGCSRCWAAAALSVENPTHSCMDRRLHTAPTPHARQAVHEVGISTRRRFHSLDEDRTMVAKQILQRTCGNAPKCVIIRCRVDQSEHQIPRSFRIMRNQLV